MKGTVTFAPGETSKTVGVQTIGDLAAIDPKRLAGPGLLCRALGITRAHTALDLVRGSALSIRDAPRLPASAVRRTKRIGLSEGATAQELWRFTIAGSPGLSR